MFFVDFFGSLGGSTCWSRGWCGSNLLKILRNLKKFSGLYAFLDLGQFDDQAIGVVFPECKAEAGVDPEVRLGVFAVICGAGQDFPVDGLTVFHGFRADLAAQDLFVSAARAVGVIGQWWASGVCGWAFQVVFLAGIEYPHGFAGGVVNQDGGDAFVGGFAANGFG